MIEVNPAIRPDESLNTFYHGRIHVLQRKSGFRFSVDAPLLADFIQTKKTDEIMELGTGCGIISLLLSIKPFHHIVALEVQPGLADLARRNVLLNNLEGRITILQKDFRFYQPYRKFDIIFSNPPYIRKNSGFLSPLEEKNIAKHELLCTLEEILSWTKAWLKETGSAYFIFPDSRRQEFEEELKKQGMKVKSCRSVYPRENEPPNFYLVQCNFTAESRDIFPPLILYGPDGHYTPEAEEIFSGRQGR
ncbi:MAG: methyltransferase [Candidatus Aminicenantes bacterium]|jgi:tRNA1Val (adenine37-N6)-methyltransferase|nr:methyltransferase [Candidatus Aminicenantes bacterium]